MKKALINLVFTATLISCERSPTKNNEVYDLMAFVIEDQQLDRNYGIKLEPEERCTLDGSEEEFLTTLILNESKIDLKDSIKLDPMVMMFEIGKLTKCLTKEDVGVMLEQSQGNKGFRWDNSGLGFDVDNKDRWYTFSVPLISKDRATAVMMIRELCPGLCGSGWTLLLRKEDNKWTSEIGQTWRH